MLLAVTHIVPSTLALVPLGMKASPAFSPVSRAVIVGIVVLISLNMVPTLRAQQGITSILNLQHPSQAVLQNGVAQVSVTFTMYYDYYSNPQGYLVFGVYYAGTSNPVEGSASSTPDPCQSLAGTPQANDAVCAMIPPVGEGAGTESASLTLTLNQPQQYSLSVVTFVWDTTNLQSGSQVQGSTSTTDFTITVTGQVVSTISTAPSNATITLGYDSGTTGGNSNEPVCGVRFSLPSGVSSARLLTIEYEEVETGTLNVHVTQPDHVTDLADSPISTTATQALNLAFNVLDVSGRDIIVSGDFYVILERTSSIRCETDNSPNVGRSFFGATLPTMTSAYDNNLMIRVVVEPITATAATTSAFSFSSTSSSTQASSSQILVASTTVSVGKGPWGVAYDSGKGEIFVVNNGGNSVSVISDATNNVLATVNVGNDPIAVAYDSGKGEVFVTNYRDNSVSVISDANNTVVATVTGLNAPVGLAYDSGKGEVFLVDNGGNSVSVISDATNTIIATVNGLSGPSGAAFDSSKGEVFVANSDGTVSVISDASNTVVAKVTGLSVGIWAGLVYDSGASEVFVAQGNTNSVSVISDASNTVVATVTGLNSPSDLAYDSADSEVFVTNNAGKSASAISDRNNTIVATVTVGDGPRALAYDSGMGEMFVANNGDVTVSVFSVSKQTSQTGTSTIPSLGSNTGTPSQTDLLLVGVIIILGALIAVAMLRRRKPGEPSTSQVARMNMVYCEQCGAQSPATKQFCEKCGAKLKP